MKRMRFILRFIKAFVLKHRTLIIFGFLLGIFVFLFSPKITRLIPRRTPVKKIGIVGRFSLSEIPLPIQRKISLGLTTLAEDGTPQPALASGWEADEEAKIYTFYLKEGLFWHDGTKLTASDVNYNFRDVETIVKDEKTVIFKLSESFSPFPAVVSRPIFKKGLVGTGDYKVKKIARTGQFIESVHLVALKKDEPHLHYRFYPTEDAAKTAFKLGEVNVLENLLVVKELENWPGARLTPILRQDRYVGLFFNTDDPWLQEKGVRQALSYAISKKSGAERVSGPISPLSWAYSGEVKEYEKDVSHAKKLLEAALEGRKDGEINLTISTVPLLLEEAEKVKTELSQLELSVKVKAFSPSEGFQILLAIQEIPPDPDQYSLWHSTQEGNITRLKSPRIDKLLEDGRKASDPGHRKETYFDLQRFLVEEAPAVFLYHPTTYTIERD